MSKNDKTRVVPANTMVQVTTPLKLVAPVYDAALVRARRVDAVQAKLYERHVAAKQAKAEQLRKAAQKAAYAAELAKLQQQFGITPTAAPEHVTAHRAPRAANGTGVTHRVRELAKQYGFNRAATLAACAAEGINAATAATQYAVAKKLANQAA